MTLKLPIQVAGNGQLAAYEQDTPEEIAQSVALLLATRPGERRSLLEYGTPDPLFDDVDIDELHELIEEWEPRADPVLISQVLNSTPGLEHLGAWLGEDMNTDPSVPGSGTTDPTQAPDLGYGIGPYGAGYYGGTIA